MLSDDVFLLNPTSYKLFLYKAPIEALNAAEIASPERDLNSRRISMGWKVLLQPEA